MYFSHKLTKFKIQVICTFLFYVQLICKKKLPFFKTVGEGIRIHLKGVTLPFWQAPDRPLRVFHRETRLIKLNNIHVVIIIFSLFENFEFLNYFGSVCEKLNGKKKCLTFKHSDYEHILCICFAIKNLEFLF